MTKKRLKVIVTSAALTVGLVAGGSYVATAQSGPNGSQNVAAATASCKTKVYFTYTKRKAPSTMGTLRLRKLYSNCTRKTLGKWKAGSGIVRNTCIKNRGSIPKGTWPTGKYDGLKKIKYYKNHQGTVKGRAWYVGAHRCKNGTLRTEMFIHTSNPFTYKSNGCIKVKPSVTKKIASLQKKYGMPKKLYVK